MLKHIYLVEIFPESAFAFYEDNSKYAFLQVVVSIKISIQIIVG